MSWKMFWQIVLLIVIVAVVLSALKCGLLRYKCGYKGKYFKGHPQHESLKK